MTVRLSRALAALAVPFLLLASVAAASPASADCAMVEFPPAGSPVIFSGTVVEERGTYARFEVDHVWEGPDLADEVWVQGGTEQATWPFSLWGQSMSSIDAEFEVGEAYVVGASDDFTTTTCSVTPADGVSLPNDVRAPTGDGAQGADVPLSPVAQSLLAATVTAALVVLVVVGRRRRHRRRRDRSGAAPRG